MSTITRAATVAAMAGLLFGCATAAQRQFQSTARNDQAALQRLHACTAAVYNSPELEPLQKDLPLNLNSASLEQLTNTNFASDVETRLILSSYPKLRACRQEFIAQISQTTPTWVPILVEMTTTNDKYLIYLLQKKLNWGDFLQRLRQTTNEANAEIVNENQRILATLEQSHEAELARRQAAIQAAADALERYGQTQQIISNMNRPLNCITMSVRPGFQNTTCQ
jgi:hypothetical protein